MGKIIFDISKLSDGFKPLLSTISSADSDAERHILLSIVDDRLCFSAYNNYFAMRYFIEYETSEDFNNICIEGKPFFDILKMSEGRCIISINKGYVGVKINRGKYKISTMNYDVFSESIKGMEKFKEIKDGGHIFNIQYLKHKIYSVINCISNDISFPALEHLYIHKNLLLSCNGGYSAITKIDTEDLDGIMINKYAINCINHITDENIRIGVLDNIVFGSSKYIEFICFLENVEEYPIDPINEIVNYHNKCYSDNLFVINVAIVPDDFIFSLSRLILISDITDNSIKIDFNSKEIKMNTGKNNISGEELIELDGTIIEDMSIYVDGKMLLKMIGNYSDEIYWRSMGPNDIQYLTDGETMHCFRKQYG